MKQRTKKFFISSVLVALAVLAMLALVLLASVLYGFSRVPFL